MKNVRCILIIELILFFMMHHFIVCSAAEKEMLSGNKYHQIAQNIDEQWALLHRARQFEEERKFSDAREIYEVLYEDWATSSIQGMAQVGLIRIYEGLKLYEQALPLVEKMLQVNRVPETLQKYQKTKQRLLQKIEAQKRGEKIEEPKAMPQNPNSIHSLADFETASYDEQKRYMEEKLPESTDILRLSKQAMMAEHAGNFKDAKGFYEQLLPQKDAVTAAQGEMAWPMLHCAVQRMSELTGDEAREKEMLVWIKENMLNPQGQYHHFLSGLMPQVIDHLKQRINKYQL